MYFYVISTLQNIYSITIVNGITSIWIKFEINEPLTKKQFTKISFHFTMQYKFKTFSTNKVLLRQQQKNHIIRSLLSTKYINI